MLQASAGRGLRGVVLLPGGRSPSFAARAEATEILVSDQTTRRVRTTTHQNAAACDPYRRSLKTKE